MNAKHRRAATTTRSLSETPGATPEAIDILERALRRGNVKNPRVYLEKIIDNLAGVRPPIVHLEPVGRPEDYRGWNAKSLRTRLTLDESTARGQVRVF